MLMAIAHKLRSAKTIFAPNSYDRVREDSVDASSSCAITSKVNACFSETLHESKSAVLS